MQVQVGGQLRLRVVQRPLETGERLVGLAYHQVERGKGDERAHERLRLVPLLVQLAQQHHALDGALRVAELRVRPAERLEQLDLVRGRGRGRGRSRARVN